VYYMERGKLIVVLLCGGDKGTHRQDITRAKAMAAEWRD
jgi:putative addiction module killer protein